MGILDFLGLTPKVNFKELHNNGAIIIDVRTPTEYKQGNYKGSKNIPLDQISLKINNLKEQNKTVILACRSGARSARATSILKQHKIEAYNAGSWTSLHSKLQ